MALQYSHDALLSHKEKVSSRPYQCMFPPCLCGFYPCKPLTLKDIQDYLGLDDVLFFLQLCVCCYFILMLCLSFFCITFRKRASQVQVKGGEVHMANAASDRVRPMGPGQAGHWRHSSGQTSGQFKSLSHEMVLFPL